PGSAGTASAGAPTQASPFADPGADPDGAAARGQGEGPGVQTGADTVSRRRAVDLSSVVGWDSGGAGASRVPQTAKRSFAMDRGNMDRDQPVCRCVLQDARLHEIGR